MRAQTEATDAADHLAALHAAHSLALDELRAMTDALQLQLMSERERHTRREEQLMTEIAQLREERDTERRADERRRSAATVQPSLLAAAATPAHGLGRSSSGGDESDAEGTPAWLKEAGGLAAHEADAETVAWGKRAEELEKAEAEAEAHRAEAEARKAEAEASKAKADASLAMAEARVHGLVAERDSLLAEREALLAENGDLLTEVARHAGHTNHKQKILYVAKLKEEIDNLKLQLREARGLAMALPGLDKENGPSFPTAGSLKEGARTVSAPATAPFGKEGARTVSAPVSARAVAGGAKPKGAVAGARAARV